MAGNCINVSLCIVIGCLPFLILSSILLGLSYNCGQGVNCTAISQIVQPTSDSVPENVTDLCQNASMTKQKIQTEFVQKAAVAICPYQLALLIFVVVVFVLIEVLVLINCYLINKTKSTPTTPTKPVSGRINPYK